MPLRLKINSGYSKHLALAEQQTGQAQAGAAQFDSQKSYYDQKNEARTKILIPFVTLWEQYKDKLPPLAQITDLYIKKFDDKVAKKENIDLQAIAQETINQGIASAGAAKQPTPTEQSGPVQQAEPAQATPPEPAQPKKQPSVFIEKLNAIKKAFKLTKEQTAVIKNLNLLFMRIRATIQESKRTQGQKEPKGWGEQYIKFKIKQAIEGSEFSDFDPLAKSNLIQILISVFKTIYLPTTTLAGKKTSTSVETIASASSATEDFTIEEGLFSKFMNKEKTLNKKQVFRFDGDTFKKYNRG